MGEAGLVHRQWEKRYGANPKQSSCKAARRPHAVQNHVGAQVSQGGKLALDEVTGDSFGSEEFGKVPAQIVSDTATLDAGLAGHDVESGLLDKRLEAASAGEEVDLQVMSFRAVLAQGAGQGYGTGGVACILEGSADNEIGMHFCSLDVVCLLINAN